LLQPFSFIFCDNLKNPYEGKEIYTVFADIDKDDDPQNGKGVKKTKINTAFKVGKTMLFLFDYGDEWIFHVQCLSVETSEKGKKYPVVIESHADAPEQYPDFEEEDAAQA
ncbi:MAG: hypothetical protein KAI76_04440, partial [Alphaproteobacteria bacterium]|nr:hypothetical protein [Alphaproteobacteria bacterium]